MEGLATLITVVAFATSVISAVLGMAGGWSPVVHLWSHCGGKLTWDEDHGMFRPDPARPATGAPGTDERQRPCRGSSGWP